jgi:PAS domain S-box-containing protein
MADMAEDRAQMAALDGLAPAVFADIDWRDIAPVAGGVGHFVLDLDTGIAHGDYALRAMMGIEGAEDGFAASEVFDRIHEEDRAAVAGSVEEARETGSPYEAEFRLAGADGSTQWIKARGRRVTGRSGRVMLVGTNYDVTEIRSAQEHAEMLAGEMAHRIKNVFTMVQSMFNMAARTSTTKEELAAAFSGRLSALTEVNRLTFASPDQRVMVSDIVDGVLGPSMEAGRVEADLEPRLALNGLAAQTVVLALNELMTNATKHGALRPEGGSVRVAMRIDGEDFLLRWHEESATPVTPPEGPKARGFGMRVLSSMTVATFTGRPSFDWRREGLRFECRWPAAEFAWGRARYTPALVDEVVGATGG